MPADPGAQAWTSAAPSASIATSACPIANDLAALVEETRPDIAIQATCSRLADAFDEIATLLIHGVNVISIAEEMAYPMCASSELAGELKRLAIDNDAVALGTGINPGFVLDLLVIALTGVCSRVDSITAERVNDLSPYGPSVLGAQGVGLTPGGIQAGGKGRHGGRAFRLSRIHPHDRGRRRLGDRAHRRAARAHRIDGAARDALRQPSSPARWPAVTIPPWPTARDER